MSDNNSKKKRKNKKNTNSNYKDDSDPNKTGFFNKTSGVTKNKKNKSYKDAKRKLTRDDLAEVGKIADNGNYFSDYKIPWYYKILWVIDLFITGLLYLMTAIVLGWIVDNYAVRDLNTNESKVLIFVEACGEVLYLILIFYLIISVYGYYLPNFSLYSPPEHNFLKNYSAGFFIIFGLFALDPTLTSKLQYVFYGTTP